MYSNKRIWMKHKSGMYTTKTGYMALSENASYQPFLNQVWKKIWSINVPKKIRFFSYLLCHGRILSNEERMKRKLSDNACCSSCGFYKEDLNHLFRNCVEAMAIWNSSYILKRYVSSQSSFLDWFIHHLLNEDVIRVDAFVGKSNVLFVFALWQIWRNRNLFIFEQIKNKVSVSSDSIFYLAKEFTETPSNMVSRVQKGPQWIAWYPPELAMVKVNTDASCTGTDEEGMGQITIGGVFRDREGKWIRGFMGAKGKSNIFNGELLAIREALSIALDYGISSLEVETDCMGAVSVMHSDYIPSVLSKAVIDDIKEMKKKFWRVSIGWRPREANRAADAMATLARRMQDLGVNLNEDAPIEIIHILEEDRKGHETPRF